MFHNWLKLETLNLRPNTKSYSNIESRSNTNNLFKNTKYKAVNYFRKKSTVNVWQGPIYVPVNGLMFKGFKGRR